jgi:hypothetical protein
MNLLYSFFWVGTIPTRQCRWNRQNVPKRWHIKFRRRGITQKKAYNAQNTATVWNQHMNLSNPDLLPSFKMENRIVILLTACIRANLLLQASLPCRPLMCVATSSGGDIEWRLTGPSLMGAPFHPLWNSAVLFRLKQFQHIHYRGFNLSLKTSNTDSSFWDKNYLFQSFSDQQMHNLLTI